MSARIAGPAVAVALCLGGLAGCSEDSAPKQEEQPIPVEQSVFGDDVKALHRAEDRAREMEARKQDLDAQIEANDETQGEKKGD
jgi:hypothetical protein